MRLRRSPNLASMGSDQRLRAGEVHRASTSSSLRATWVLNRGEGAGPAPEAPRAGRNHLRRGGGLREARAHVGASLGRHAQGFRIPWRAGRHRNPTSSAHSEAARPLPSSWWSWSIQMCRDGHRVGARARPHDDAAASGAGDGDRPGLRGSDGVVVVGGVVAGTERDDGDAQQGSEPAARISADSCALTWIMTSPPPGNRVWRLPGQSARRQGAPRRQPPGRRLECQRTADLRRTRLGQARLATLSGSSFAPAGRRRRESRSG